LGTLYDLISRYNSISISGMCKNAGKTTVLNSIIDHIPEVETTALTSIGRDGESVDIVTGTKKPGIYIKKGSIFATAESLLNYCDITKEILDTTGIKTPLGEVIIVRALSDGNLQLAGPSIISQLSVVSKLFRDHGADRVIIDGAASRKTLCTRMLTDAAILCTGASFSPDMDETIAETAHMCNLLMTSELSELRQKINPENLNGKYLFTADSKTMLQEGADLTAAVKEAKQNDVLYTSGALTDSLLNPLIYKGIPKGFTFAAYDASKLLISSDCMRRLKASNAKLGVLEPINLAAVTINPISAYGNHYDSAKFKREMTKAVSVPVINVRE